MAHTVSPLAPESFPNLPEIAGVKLAAAATGIRYKGRPDVLLATLMPGTAAAGCFTTDESRGGRLKSTGVLLFRPISTRSARIAVTKTVLINIMMFIYNLARLLTS